MSVFRSTVKLRPIGHVQVQPLSNHLDHCQNHGWNRSHCPGKLGLWLKQTTQWRLIRSQLSRHVIHRLMHAATGELGLWSQQITRQRLTWLLLTVLSAHTILHRRFCFRSVFSYLDTLQRGLLFVNGFLLLWLSDLVSVPTTPQSYGSQTREVLLN